MKKWPTKPLGECVAPKELWNEGRDPRKRIKYVELAGIDNERGVIATFSDIEAGKAPSRARKIIRKGDVIFATTRPNLKNIAVVPDELDGEICSTGFCVMRPRPELISTGWLFAALRSDWFINQVVRHDEKNAYPSVSDAEVLAVPIPLPPLAEQRRLVARIEALTARLAQARQARQDAVAEADELTSLLQRNTYEQLLEDCDAAPLSEIGQVFSGCTPSKARAEYWDGEVPWIAPKEMKVFHIGDSSVRLSRQAVDDEVARLLPAPVVLMVVRGMILAKRVPVAVTTQPVTINQDMKAFRPRKGIEAEFLAHMVCGAGEELKGRVEVAGHGTCKLETDAWGALPIPIPGIATQRRIVARLDALSAKQSDLHRLQAETDADLADFTPALLAKAFRGEL